MDNAIGSAASWRVRHALSQNRPIAIVSN